MDTPLSVREIIFQHYQTSQYTQQQIADMVHCPRSTVRDIIHHFQSTNILDIQRKGRCGRKKLLSIRDERAIVRRSIANPRLTAREIQADVGGRVGRVSVETIKRSLRRSGLRSYRPTKSPSLDSRKMAVRLRWCRTYQHWNATQWQKVSDFNRPCATYVIFLF